MDNIILIGFMGSGKSTVGIRLSYRLRRAMEDTDKLIEKEEGRTISEIFAADGENYFRELETACLKKLLRTMKHKIISTGGQTHGVAQFIINKRGSLFGDLNLIPEFIGIDSLIKQHLQSIIRLSARLCHHPMLLSDHPKLPDQKFLAIQGTSVGLSPHDEDAVIEDAAFYKKIHTGFDLIYKPFTTRFMKLVAEAGGKSYNGLNLRLTWHGKDRSHPYYILYSRPACGPMY